MVSIIRIVVYLVYAGVLLFWETTRSRILNLKAQTLNPKYVQSFAQVEGRAVGASVGYPDPVDLSHWLLGCMSCGSSHEHGARI